MKLNLYSLRALVALGTSAFCMLSGSGRQTFTDSFNANNITTTYGHSYFPSSGIDYFLDVELPGDFFRIGNSKLGSGSEKYNYRIAAVGNYRNARLQAVNALVYFTSANSKIPCKLNIYSSDDNMSDEAPLTLEEIRNQHLNTKIDYTFSKKDGPQSFPLDSPAKYVCLFPTDDTRINFNLLEFVWEDGSLPLTTGYLVTGTTAFSADSQKYVLATSEGMSVSNSADDKVCRLYVYTEFESQELALYDETPLLTMVANDGGITLATADDKYLAVSNSELTFSDAPYIWELTADETSESLSVSDSEGRLLAYDKSNGKFLLVSPEKASGYESVELYEARITAPRAYYGESYTPLTDDCALSSGETIIIEAPEGTDLYYRITDLKNTVGNAAAEPMASEATDDDEWIKADSYTHRFTHESSAASFIEAKTVTPDGKSSLPLRFQLRDDVVTSLTIPADSSIENSPALYYNLQGQPVANPTHGLYIRRTPEGARLVKL